MNRNYWLEILLLSEIFCALHYFEILCEVPSNSDNVDSENNCEQDEDLMDFLEAYNKGFLKVTREVTIAEWNFFTNGTRPNKLEVLRVKEKDDKFRRIFAKRLKKYDWENCRQSNVSLYAEFKDISFLGPTALGKGNKKLYDNLKLIMSNSYSTVEIKSYDGSEYLKSLPDMNKVMRNSRDPEERSFIWESFRTATARKLRSRYKRFLKLSMKVAKKNNIQDMSEFVLLPYRDEGFDAIIENLWERLVPMYKALHAYVREKLLEEYGPHNMSADGRIPAHLLGCIYDRSWDNNLEEIKPFDDTEPVDITHDMKKKHVTTKEMFEIAEKFYISLGFKEMTPTFWKKSIIEKPQTLNFSCDPHTYDFLDQEDYRISMCSKVNMRQLVIAHRVMGGIHYYMQWAHLPAVFRKEPCPGFLLAVGDAVALSAYSIKYMQHLGYLEDFEENTKSDITFLLRIAKMKIATLPSVYVTDLWRWNIYKRVIKMKELNTEYWNLMSELEGTCPWVKRTEKDLDAAAAFEVASDESVIHEFVAAVLQFQIHKTLCKDAGHKGPLFKCSIFNSKKAGKRLRSMMSLGSTVSWRQAIIKITDGESDKLDVQPMQEYFEPLLKWLSKQELESGWNTSDPMICSKPWESSSDETKEPSTPEPQLTKLQSLNTPPEIETSDKETSTMWELTTPNEQSQQQFEESQEVGNSLESENELYVAKLHSLNTLPKIETSNTEPSTMWSLTTPNEQSQQQFEESQEVGNSLESENAFYETKFHSFNTPPEIETSNKEPSTMWELTTPNEQSQQQFEDS